MARITRSKPDESIAQRFREKWWFLKGEEKFRLFRRSPADQGFEIISRHPNFSGRFPGGFRDFRRLGLMAEVELEHSKKRVAFDCTESSKRILAGIKVKLEHGLQLKEDLQLQPSDRAARTKVASHLIGFKRLSFPRVRLDLSKLMASLEEQHGAPVLAKHVSASVRTFLTKNAAYLKHRKRGLRGRTHRVKPLRPVTIALGCIALDWHRAGLKAGALRGWLRTNGFSLAPLKLKKVSTARRWDNHRSAIERCLKKVQLK